MIKKLKLAKIDPDVPNPSVETLLHAFIPNRFVLHTHSNAVLALTNQADGIERCKKVFGSKAGIVPYAMSGFKLAKKAGLIYKRMPSIFGLIIMKHGIFTVGDTAKEAYDRMIRLVSMAESELKNNRRNIFVTKKITNKLLSISEVAPIIRGAVGPGWLLDFRTNKLIKNFIMGKELSRYGAAGPVTPDHVVWTKIKPLILPKPIIGHKFSEGV